jgi:NADH dehydrogenase
LFTDCAVVINLVGILNPRGRATFESVHVNLVAKVMAAARTAGVRRVLHMSALGAGENAPSRYLRSRGQGEGVARAVPHPELPHPKVTIFRPSVIFGPDDSLTNRFARLLRMSYGFMPLARARALFAPISVVDVGEAYMRALSSHRSEGATYELCGPDNLTLEEIVRLTARIAQLPCHILRLPDALGRLQGIVLGLLPGKPFTLDNFRSLTRDSVCQTDGCRELGIRPLSMLAEVPLYLAPQPEFP